MDPITVESYVRWGKLVKTWATGKCYFDPPITLAQLPIPRTIAELKAQIALVGAGIHIPDNIAGLAFFHYNADTLAIRLPPKERIEAKEQELQQGTNDYPFPDFYTDFINRPLSPAVKMDVHACRIGDYTISMCG
jgi:hypothetical protein